MGYIDDVFFRFFNPIRRKTQSRKRFIRRAPRKRARRVARKRVRRIVRRRPIRRTPRKRPIRRTPRKRVVRRAPRKRPIRRTPRKRAVRRAPRKRPIRRTLRKRPVRRAPRKRPVRRTPRKRAVRRAPRKRVARRVERKTSGLLRVVDVWYRHLDEMKARVRLEMRRSRYTEKVGKVHFPTEYMTPGGWMTDAPSQHLWKRCKELILYYTYYTIQWRRKRTMIASVEYHVGQYRMRTLPIRPDKINLERITEAFKRLTKTRFSDVSRTKDSMFVVVLHDGLGYYITVW